MYLHYCQLLLLLSNYCLKIDVTHVVIIREECEGDIDYGSRVSGDDVYNGSAEPVLVLLSNLYSEDNRILSR